MFVVKIKFLLFLGCDDICGVFTSRGIRLNLPEPKDQLLILFMCSTANTSFHFSA